MNKNIISAFALLSFLATGSLSAGVDPYLYRPRRTARPARRTTGPAKRVDVTPSRVEAAEAALERRAVPTPPPAPPVAEKVVPADSRGDLLAEIREGKELRHVETTEKTYVENPLTKTKQFKKAFTLKKPEDQAKFIEAAHQIKIDMKSTPQRFTAYDWAYKILGYMMQNVMKNKDRIGKTTWDAASKTVDAMTAAVENNILQDKTTFTRKWKKMEPKKQTVYLNRLKKARTQLDEIATSRKRS